MSKFYIWVDDNAVSSNCMTDTAFSTDSQRSTGFQAGKPASAIRINTAIRQANLLSVGIVNALSIPDNLSVTSSVTDITNWFQSTNLFKVGELFTVGANNVETILNKTIRPLTNNISLGTSVNRFVNVYATNCYMTTLNNVAVSNIFESDNMTVKKATNATNSTNATNTVNIRNKNNQNVTLQSALLDMVYPVGSIYMSVNNTSPALFLGGTWSQLKDRFLLGAGDTYSNDTTGGEATHTLTASEMPSHNHSQQISGVGDKSGTITWSVGSQSSTTQTSYRGLANDSVTYIRSVSSAYSPPLTTVNTGGGQSHNNMPPYLVVYMWKRTA